MKLINHFIIIFFTILISILIINYTRDSILKLDKPFYSQKLKKPFIYQYKNTDLPLSISTSLDYQKYSDYVERGFKLNSYYFYLKHKLEKSVNETKIKYNKEIIITKYSIFLLSFIFLIMMADILINHSIKIYKNI